MIELALTDGIVRGEFEGWTYLIWHMRGELMPWRSFAWSDDAGFRRVTYGDDRHVAEDAREEIKRAINLASRD